MEIVTIPEEVLRFGQTSADDAARILLKMTQEFFGEGSTLRIVPMSERAIYDEAVQTFVDFLRNVPATSSVVVLDMDRCIVRYHLQLRGLPPLMDRDQVLIKHLRVFEKVPNNGPL